MLWSVESYKNKLASFEAMLVQNCDPASYWLTGVECRATSVRGWAEREPSIWAGTGYLVLVFEIPIPEKILFSEMVSGSNFHLLTYFNDEIPNISFQKTTRPLGCPLIWCLCMLEYTQETLSQEDSARESWKIPAGFWFCWVQILGKPLSFFGSFSKIKQLQWMIRANR